jgi:phenylpropionate dioxygenase-like ring-hydroxylating dioxygenase large terminal subunit
MANGAIAINGSAIRVSPARPAAATRYTADVLRSMVRPGLVHSAIYTDQEIFELEMERIFHRSWLYIGHEGEVPDKGDYRLRTLGRQPVILVRGSDGVVRVLMNRCRHRGAIVCENEAGNEKVFRCWFHGWTYDTTGRLASVSMPDGYGEDFSLEAHSLTPAPRTGNYRGFVFASAAAEGPTLEEYLGRAAAMIDVLVDASPVREIEVNSGCHKTVYNGNWKMVGMDGYHPNFVHASAVDVWQRKADSGMGATYRANPFGSKTATVTRSLGNGHVMLDLRQHRLDLYDEQYEPFLRSVPGGPEYIDAMVKRDGPELARRLLATAGDPHVGLFPNMQIIGNQIRIITPLSPGQTEVFMFPVLLKGVSPEINALRIRQHESFYGPASAGSPDDAEIFERTQRGMMAAIDPWLDISRGMHREFVDSDGTVVGHATDEVPQREQARQWLEMMTSEY